MKNLIIDLDGTLTIDSKLAYHEKELNQSVYQKLLEYKKMGFKITIFTSRNMRTFAGDIKKIQKESLPIITAWLKQHNVPYDEVVIGKPWCGFDGFYIDDKAIRPSEFTQKSYQEINALLTNEALQNQNTTGGGGVKYS